jgi:hypothetical protein
VAVVSETDLPYFGVTKEVPMKFTIDVPLDVFEALAKQAIREQRHTPQQAAWLLTRWVRDGDKEPTGRREPVGVGKGEQET